MELNEQIERLEIAGIHLSEAELKRYLSYPDIIKVTTTIPQGYKCCTKCRMTKKLYLFNKNSASKDGHTTQCKECQKSNAKKSYTRTKHKKQYKLYYQEHKEQKQEQSRQYYQTHKEELKKKHAAYRNTKAGKKAMQRAHQKRADTMKANQGIPYTREMVIERDCRGGTEPICYLCGKPITSTGALHMDHVIPVVMGGLDCFSNVACVHDECNLRKSKDAREITEEQVVTIQKMSDEYMDTHQELFPEIFGAPEVVESNSDGE